MTQWGYCEVDFDGSVTNIFYYGEDGEYIDGTNKHPRLGVLLAILGHDGWENISSWWRSDRKVTYMLKRPCQAEWTKEDKARAQEAYRKGHPYDRV